MFSFAVTDALENCGMTMVASIPRITTTISISISVNAPRLERRMLLRSDGVGLLLRLNIPLPFQALGHVLRPPNPVPRSANTGGQGDDPCPPGIRLVNQLSL